MYKSIFAAVATLAISTTASANLGNMALVAGTLTADNHYGLFVGGADGQDLQFIGRNEKGANGAPGQYNWSVAETWDFLVAPGQYLYVMAWDDGGPQGWIGSFSWNGGVLNSNTAQWRAAVAPAGNPGAQGDLPNEATLGAYVAAAQWTVPTAAMANGGAPWGSIDGVGGASWIWHDSLGNASQSDAAFAMFRSADPLLPSVNPQVAAVPEPSAYAMMGLGAGLVLLASRRARRPGARALGD